MLNANSTPQSSTMFSRHVVESLACGTPVVTTQSTGMSQMLGRHINITRCVGETVNHLNVLLSDKEIRDREGHLAYRYVHEHHTYRHRVDEMLSKVGLKPQLRSPSVSVIAATCRPGNVAHLLENFAKQSYQEKELLLILNNASFDIDAIRTQTQALSNVCILQVEKRSTLGAYLNRGVEAASGEYIAKMDDDDYYGERYLSDMMLAANFSDAEVLGKGTYFVYMESGNKMVLRERKAEHQYVSFVTGATLTSRREVLQRIPFSDRTGGEDSHFLRKVVRAGCRIYSVDRFNYVCLRYENLGKHTWKIEETKFLESCRYLQQGMNLRRVMI